jgi:hypothetical protein
VRLYDHTPNNLRNKAQSHSSDLEEIGHFCYNRREIHPNIHERI